METLSLKIKGLSPLMMHADVLANPLHETTKQHKLLTSKRKKTDEDHELIARSEYLAGIYYDKTAGVYIPGQNFDACFLAGAKLQKQGVKWTRGCVVLTDKAALVYKGPKTPEKLWEDQRFVDCRGVKVGRAKIMRYRPVFLEWSTAVEVAVNLEVIDLHDVARAIEDAGRLIGVCEYRPRFGRFEVQYDDK